MAVPPKEEILSIRLDDEYKDKDVLIIALRGILNTFSSVQVMKILEPSIFTRFNHFVFDYEELTFIDSMGLSAMVIIFKRIESEQGTISVINVKDSIRTVFEITKVIRKIPILPTMEDALKQIEERKDNKE